MLKLISRLLFLLLLLHTSGLVTGQPPRGPFVISPQILPDKKVTFRYLAPAAKDVKLGGGQLGAANAQMKKD